MMKSIDIVPTRINPIPANRNSFIRCLDRVPTLSVGQKTKSVLRIGCSSDEHLTSTERLWEVIGFNFGVVTN